MSELTLLLQMAETYAHHVQKIQGSTLMQIKQNVNQFEATVLGQKEKYEMMVINQMETAAQKIVKLKKKAGSEEVEKELKKIHALNVDEATTEIALWIRNIE